MFDLSNLLNLDYRAEARSLKTFPFPLLDIHSHITSAKAARVYKEAAALYGVRRTYSMTPHETMDEVKAEMGEAIEFIAVPSFFAQDRKQEMLIDFPARLEKYKAQGVKIIKFWSAPRGVDFGSAVGQSDLFRLNAPHRVELMQRAYELGFLFMAHVGDPDTWFKAKYTDPAMYGSKPDQYPALEELLDRFTNPWILAHMCGWPEDLEFLDGMLSRHPNLHLDTSATKWMVRELSKHSTADFLRFMTKWTGRIFFGSDIVAGTGDFHDAAKDGNNDRVFNLYASRYWALRTLFETDYEGLSPIADPDLAMVNPEQFSETDAPELRGKKLPEHILRSIYHDALTACLERHASAA